MGNNIQTFQQTKGMPYNRGVTLSQRGERGIALMGRSGLQHPRRILPEQPKSPHVSKPMSYNEVNQLGSHVVVGLVNQRSRTYRAILSHNVTVPIQLVNENPAFREVANDGLESFLQVNRNSHADLLGRMSVQNVRTLFQDCGKHLKNQDMIVFADSINQLIEDRNSPLFEMLDDIAALVEDEDYDDEFMKPATDAIEDVRTILEGASRYVNGYFPYGTVYPDGDGGLRTEWIEPGCELRLVIPANQNSRRYIYHERKDDFQNDYEVTSIRLGYWLNWLNKYAHSTG